MRGIRTVLLGAAIVTLAGCGGSQEASDTTGEPPATTIATTTVAAESTTTAAPATTQVTTTSTASTTTTAAPATTTTIAPATTTTVDPSLVAGTERVDEFGIAQVWVPAGTFLMGTGDTSGLEPPSWATTELRSEQPQHEVVLSRGYWIDTHEVTNAAFAEFVAADGYTTQAYWSEDGWAWVSRRQDVGPEACTTDAPDHPRACITWYEAEAYAAWRGGRLPTEAEWEYAARGPEAHIYPWGAEWDPTLANIVDSDGSTPVGSYPVGASWVGALDMSGNVMEWVADWWSTSYYETDEARIDPTGPGGGSTKVEKGGWFGNVAYVGRTAYRHFEDPPTYQDHHIGVRIVTPG